jgi:hypothetical protein
MFVCDPFNGQLRDFCHDGGGGPEFLLKYGAAGHSFRTAGQARKSGGGLTEK